MNGLLHRLAARAAGTAVTVRSDARLPHHGAAFGWADGAEAEVAAPHEAAPPDMRNVSIAPIAPIAPMEDGPLPPARIAPARLGPQGVESMDLSNPMPGQAEALHRSRARDSARLDEPAPAVAEPPLLMRAGTTPASANAAPPIRREPFDPAFADARMVMFDLELDLEPAAGSTAPGPAADPLPMMPMMPMLPRNGDRPAALVARPAAQRGAWPQASSGATADSATEVHVHIGRIDVTALHEAPAPRRKPAAAPGPMSLDAYLTRPRRA